MVDEIAILWCHSVMGWLCFYILMGAGLEGLKEVPCSSNTESHPDLTHRRNGQLEDRLPSFFV